MSKHHVSNFGFYGKTMPQDLDGYTYTTAEEWLLTDDVQFGITEDMAYELASEAREAIETAQMCLDSFRRASK